MALDRLRLRPAHLDAMRADVQQAWPNEGCGLLAGPPGQVERVYPVANVYRSPVEYMLDPAEQVRVLLEIEAVGWELCGIYHSHPAGPPVPSATDIARAYYPEAVYVILSPTVADEWSVRAFRIEAGLVREVLLEISE